MDEDCPVCHGEGVIVIQRGMDPQTEDDLDCTDCGGTGRVTITRARRLAERADDSRSRALVDHLGASAHHWDAR